MSQSYGLYYSFGSRAVSFSLLHVHVAANIKELVAEVKLTHTYLNDTAVSRKAAYSFPISARSSVCSFLIIKQDGTRVVFHVQEKGEAREMAMQGTQAALMGQQTPDVRQLVVGNVQPHEKVQIELVYAIELTEDEENDSIRFHLPAHLGSVYGQLPLSFAPQNDHSRYFSAPFQRQTPFLEIFVTVEAVAPIASITCPSHIVLTELGLDPALPHAQEIPFVNYARISLTSEAPLDKDFVLAVKSAGLDAPRCVAELHPIHPTTALKFTLVPRFKLPDLARQEFIFLVDRSASMAGSRIAAARKALVVMLRSLPAKGSLFQIASFGSACMMLWNGGSKHYKQATLDVATQYVDSMQADYGGTDVRNALQACFVTRRVDRPTNVFVMTDGRASDLDGVLAEVRGAVAWAPALAYLRVFVLGIGHSASTAMCKGITRAGNGTYTMVEQRETNFTSKIARMLKAACAPSLANVALDWGLSSGDLKPSDSVTKDDVAFENAQPVSLHPEDAFFPPAQIQQSPFKIKTLNPGNRLTVYAILQGKTVPKTVTLTGVAEDGSEFKLSVPVVLSHAADSPVIHTLAAKKIIHDLHALITPENPDDTDLLVRAIKASIVRLAKMYFISSSETSFVTVDESTGQSYPVPVRMPVDRKQAGAPVVAVKAYRRRPKNTVQRLPAATRTAQRRLSSANLVDASFKDKQRLRRHCYNCKTLDASAVARTFYSPSWRRSALRPGKIVCIQCALFERKYSRPRPLFFHEIRRNKRNEQGRQTEVRVTVADMDPLEALARLQRFDGYFSLEVLSIVRLNVDVMEARAAFMDVSEVFPTLLGMAFLRTKLGATIEHDSWEAMHNKARAFVGQRLLGTGNSVDVDELEARAVSILA
ncbi:hypothetical protein MVEN_01673800 [Mycena venus]|uniref:VIT-domain-containing protein n=1 Tax=Mycena venus TaxID=2733690 RepID=A0A8H7CR29_9AGAR|nr:hypothetical protein MVEN_01673800 [Mycena venus]